mmetsp:Transcript_57670/g.134335  ORF Transcript_57670/g.134335 Transcript_57670/m.134335 type:complete len:129 (-) Transcript_57670:43-429(-)
MQRLILSPLIFGGLVQVIHALSARQRSGPSGAGLLQETAHNGSDQRKLFFFTHHKTGTFLMRQFASSLHTVLGMEVKLRLMDRKVEIKELIAMGDPDILNVRSYCHSLGYEGDTVDWSHTLDLESDPV